MPWLTHPLLCLRRCISNVSCQLANRLHLTRLWLAYWLLHLPLLRSPSSYRAPANCLFSIEKRLDRGPRCRDCAIARVGKWEKMEAHRACKKTSWLASKWPGHQYAPGSARYGGRAHQLTRGLPAVAGQDRLKCITTTMPLETPDIWLLSTGSWLVSRGGTEGAPPGPELITPCQARPLQDISLFQ